MGLSFTIAAGPCQRSYSQVLVPRNSWPYFTVSDSRLPQPGGPSLRIYMRQEQGGPIITPGTGFPFLVASYYSHGHGGGIRTRLPMSRVESYEYVMTDGQSASVSWNKVPIWGLRPDFYYCQTVAGLLMWGAGLLMWGALCDDRTGRRLQLLLGLASAVILGSESCVTHDHILLSRLHFLSPPTTRRATVEVFDSASTHQKSKSKAHCDWLSVSQSVSQSVSKSWCRAPSWPVIYCCLTVMVLFLWGALSDERMGLYFVYAAGPCQLSLSRVRVPWVSRPYFTVSDLKLPFSSPPTTRRASTRQSGSPYITSARTA
jgi:hypothetical protein